MRPPCARFAAKSEGVNLSQPVRPKFTPSNLSLVFHAALIFGSVTQHRFAALSARLQHLGIWANRCSKARMLRRLAKQVGGVERDAPHRARPPPHQTVRADFPHTASRVKLSLPIPLACQRNQSHMLKFAIVCLCIFQLIPSLAPAVQPDVHSEL